MFANLYILDFVLLPMLLLLVALASFAKAGWLRAWVIVILLVVILFSQISLEPVARGVSSSRHAQGRWSPDFRDGVSDMTDAVKDFTPYIVISAFGLAILAFRKNKNRVTQEKK
jgi:hypothetical protein